MSVAKRASKMSKIEEELVESIGLDEHDEKNSMGGRKSK